jgi:hypothetical protein
MASCVSAIRRRETRWQLVVLLSSQGQNQLFMSHLLLGDCGEDGVIRAWRSVLPRRVRETPARAPALFMGEKGSVPSLAPPPFLPLPLHKPAPFSPQNPSRRRRFFSDLGRLQSLLPPPATRASSYQPPLHR